MLTTLFLIIGVIIVVFLFFNWSNSGAAPANNNKQHHDTTKVKHTTKKKVQPVVTSRKNQGPKIVKHPLCIQEIKDSKYATESIAIDSKQTFIASVSQDNLIQLHSIEDKKIVKHKLDSEANKICISSDGHYILVAFSDSKELHAYQIVKSGNTKTLKQVRVFPNKHPKSNILSLQLASNNQFLISCGNDTTINVWNLKGDLITSLNTRQMKNNMAIISPDSTMITAAASMSDVRIWKVRVNKDDSSFTIDEKVFTYLRGHSSFVYWVTFSQDSKKILTCSKDSTWKYWSLEVNYQLEEHPKILLSGNHPDNGVYTRVELSHDETYFVGLTDNSTSLHVWNLTTSELVHKINAPHLGYILDLTWFPAENKFATAGSDGFIRIFHVDK